MSIPPRINTSFDTNESPVKGPVKSPLSGNPLKYDPELIALIEQVDSLHTYRAFRRWRASFIRRFMSFLTEKGMKPAEEFYQTYTSNMEAYEKKVNKVSMFIEKGDISPDRTTVKGRNTLNEMTKTMTEIIEETEMLIPATNLEEKKRGYNKYHLGCVLVQDGFMEYDRMLRCNETKKEMRKKGCLDDVADRQQLEEIDNYERQIQRFRDVMDDLGMHEVMLKCREFSEGEIDEIVFLDPKTGAVIELPRELCFSTGILSIIQDAEGKDRIREEETSRTEKEEMIPTIKIKFNLL